MAPDKIGRYHVDRLLGRGGFASVYLAKDPFVKRQVAVKLLPAQFTDTPAMRARFKQEAEIIATLEHPAIVPIYDYGEHGDQPFIVMRYMAGGTLAERLSRKHLSLNDAIHILSRISSALDRAHDQGIIHRDLKPGNILFDQYGEAYLSDFGIARLTEASLELTGGGAIGTPAYMSPEQVYGDRPVDGRSDVYALGVILFEMLTGTVPYKADTPAKLMMKHVLEPVPRILEVNPDLPPGCDQLLERVMAKEPNDRFAKATEFATAVTLLSPTRQASTMPAETVLPALEKPEPVQPPPPKLSAPNEETVLETPTPPEVRRMAQDAATPSPDFGDETSIEVTPSTPIAVQETEATSPIPTPSQPAPAKSERPSWVKPGLIAVGALFIVVLLIGFAIVSSGILNREEVVDNDNTAGEQTNTTDNTDGDNTAGEETVALRPTPAGANALPTGTDDGLPARAISTFEQRFQLGRGFTTQLAVNPDGTILAVGSGIGVWLYNTNTLGPLGLLEGHSAPVETVAWSPDGRLASGSQDGTIIIWDAESKQALHTLEENHDIVSTLDWSFDGTRLASGGFDTVVRIWDTANWDELYALEGHTEAINMVSFPFDYSSRIASASDDGTVKVWLLDDGILDFTMDHDDAVEAVLWVVDGGRLLTATADGMIRVRRGDDGALLDQWQAHEYGLITMQQSPSGWNMVTTGSDGFIRLWDVENGELLAEWGGENNSPVAPAWMPDSRTIALSFTDNLVGIWPADDPGDGVSMRLHTGSVGSIAWGRDGSGLVSGHIGDGRIRIWNLTNRQQVGEIDGFTGEGQALSISDDGTLLVRPNVAVEVLQINGLSDLNGDIEPIFAGTDDSYVNAATLSPDNTQVAAINWDNILRVWNLGDPNPMVEVEGAGANAIAWSPDGELLASPVSDQTGIIIWDSQSGDQRHVINYSGDGNISGLDWSPEGDYLASVDTAGTLSIWERETWGLAVSFESFGSSLNSVDWAPNGRYVAAGSWSGSIYVWDATASRGTDPILHIDLAHLAPVVAIAWSPEGNMLASGSYDGTVKIWGVANN